MQPTERYWFPAKRFGWGWGLPRTWEGWLVLAAYVISVVALGVLVPERRGMFAAGLLVATAVLLWVCLKKGEPARWRWGNR
jgi:hypothetical protein